MSKRNGHKGFHHHSNLSSKPPPAISICNHPRIYTFLRERVRGQDTSLNGLASILSRLLQPHTERKVYKATLGGAEGSGKGTTVETVRYLLGMDPGYIYASQFVSLSGSAVSDNKSKAGGKEGVSLMKRLHKATQTAKSPETGKKETLPYICLFIDNVDKACAKFIDCVGPLLENGTYTMGSNESFSIPKKTPLLVLFTTNCASAGIASMTKLDDSVAAEMIRLTLKQRWPEGNLMKRMEPIYPFYILKAETVRPILMTKFEEYVRDSDISNKYGKGTMQYSMEVKTMIVDHVLAKVNTAHGIQGSISQLINKLDIFFSIGLGALDTLLIDTGGDQKNLMSPIVVTTHSIDTNRFRESLDQQLESVVKELRQAASSTSCAEKRLSVCNVIDSILDNPENQQIMAECDTKQEGTVNAVAMAYGDISLCSLVMNITYNNYQVINHLDQEEEVRALKKKLRRYKSNLKEVIQAIDHSCSESSFNTTMKEIADSKRQLIESSGSSSGDDDYSDDSRDYYHHTKRLPANNNSPSSLKNHSLEMSKKRTRPPPCIKRKLPSPQIVAPVRHTNRNVISLSQHLKDQENANHRDKRIRLSQSEMTLDYSDEVDLYIDEATDEDDIFNDTNEHSCLSDILSEEEEEEVVVVKKKKKKKQEMKEVLMITNTPTHKEKESEVKMPEITIESEEEEDEKPRSCTSCNQMRSASAFIRKRKDCKSGISVSTVCVVCRK